MKRIRPIDASGLMNLLEKELDMNGITDWGKGYMDAIHDAMEHVKFMPTLEQNEIKHGHWKLLDDYKLHRIEWRMIGGNPVERSYDKFCNKFGGTKHVLRDAIKDKYGKYHDDIIYEIINKQQ